MQKDNQPQNNNPENFYQHPGYLKAISIPKEHSHFQYGNFRWDKIPMFTVLTGVNGCGKTQLFDAIFRSATFGQNDGEAYLHFEGQTPPQILVINSDTSKSNDNSFDSYAKHFETFERMSNALQWYRDHKNEPNLLIQYISYQEKFPLFDKIIREEPPESMPNIRSHENPAHVYHDILLLREHGIHITELSNPLRLLRRFLEMRLTSLKEINQYFIDNNFKYVVNSDIRFIDKNTKKIIGNTNLSLGERIVFMTIAWKVYSSIFPKTPGNFVLLLDEPDAHIHPPLTKSFIDTLVNQVVGEQKIQVIMTTHRPTTLCLVPEKSIWLMESTDKNITISQQKNRRQAIAALTSDLVAVNEKFRIVFVEADDDVKLYQHIWNQLIASKAIASNYQVIFRSHGEKRNDGKNDNSSCDQVARLVNKMVMTGVESATLADFIFGVVDNDNKEPPQNNNILAPERYAIENYIFDPVNLYFYLKHVRHPSQEFQQVEKKLCALNIPNLVDDLPWNDTTLVNTIIQAIADAMTHEVINYYLANRKTSLANTIKELTGKPRYNMLDLNNPGSQKVTVEFLEGIKVTYPQMFVDMRGKQVKHIVISTFTQNTTQLISMSDIINKLPKTGVLVAKDLWDLMMQLNVEIKPEKFEAIAAAPKAQMSEKNVDVQKYKQQILELEEKLKRQKAASSTRIKALEDRNKTIKSQQARIAELEAQLAKQSEANEPDNSNLLTTVATKTGSPIHQTQSDAAANTKNRNSFVMN